MDRISSVVLQQISNYDLPYEEITPEVFVNYVVKKLQGNFKCEHIDKTHRLSPHCVEGLEILTTIRSCFDYCVDNRLIDDNGDHSSEKLEFNHSPTHGITHDNKTRDVCQKISTGIEFVTERMQLEAISIDSPEKWYGRVCRMLAMDCFIVQCLSLQEESDCIFASHIIKNVVCKCALQYDKIAMILKYIEDKWTRTKRVRAIELDYINTFMSKQHSEDECRVRTRVYYWFVNDIPFSLKSTFVHKLAESENRNYQDNILILSVVGKFLKYSVVSHKEVPSCIGTLALDILVSHKEIFFSVPNCKRHLGKVMLGKFIKQLNNFISFKFLLENSEPSNITLNMCKKVTECFLCMFDLCETRGYFSSLTFWENKDLDNKRNCVHSQHSPQLNLVVMREMLLLAVKSSALLTCAEGDATKGTISSFQAVCECFQLWMREHFEENQLSSGWIPVLLGDQDEKWISTLFCLLLVYQNLFHRSADMKWRNSELEVSEKCSFKNHNGFTRTLSTTKEHKTVAPPSVEELLRTSTDNSNISTSIDTENVMLSTESHMQHGKESGVFWKSICPHVLFLQFVTFICYDHLVVSDFLISPETNFLEYFTKYLIYARENWDSFIFCCHEQSEQSDGEQQSLSHLHISKSSANPVHGNNNMQVPDEAGCHQTPYLFSEQREKRQRCDSLETSSQPNKSKKKKHAKSLVSYAVSDSDSSESECGDNNTPPCLSVDEKSNSDKEKCKLTSNDTYPYVAAASYEATTVTDPNKTTMHPNNILSDDEFNSSSGSSSSTEDIRSAEVNEVNFQMEEGTEGSHVKNVLESVMTMLIRLRFHLERLENHNLIPYKAELLLNLLQSCEEKYENVL